MEKIKGFLIINGKKIYNTSESIDIINPSTEEIIGEMPVANSSFMQESIDVANKSFYEWSNFNLKKRSDFLHKAAIKVRERLEEIARTLTLEQGKPLNEARSEVSTSAEIVDYYAEEVKRIRGINYWTDRSDIKSQIIYQPIGVVGTISPFNYPVSLTAFKVAPALATGNTVVVKPSSKTPLSVNLFIDCFLEAGLPDGVLNFISGSGKWLVESPLVNKISFTGSTETGKKIASICGSHMKRLTLELGGNSPVIIFSDSDLERTAKDCCYRAFRNMGQVCNSINRIYIERAAEKDFLDCLVSEAKKLKISDGLLNPNADLGPMVSKEGLNKTIDHIQDAIRRGGKIIFGGKKPEGFIKGYFFEPTIISLANHQMKVMNEETFGPIAPVMVFENIDEAIKLANNSKYGLVSYIYTDDLSKAIYISEKLQYGTVNINNIHGAEVGYPYCGWKESGTGVEVSEHALHEYIYLKHVRMKINLI